MLLTLKMTVTRGNSNGVSLSSSHTKSLARHEVHHEIDHFSVPGRAGRLVLQESTHISVSRVNQPKSRSFCTIILSETRQVILRL
jgi:hypothetical protein